MDVKTLGALPRLLPTPADLEKAAGTPDAAPAGTSFGQVLKDIVHQNQVIFLSNLFLSFRSAGVPNVITIPPAMMSQVQNINRISKSREPMIIASPMSAYNQNSAAAGL